MCHQIMKEIDTIRTSSRVSVDLAGWRHHTGIAMDEYFFFSLQIRNEISTEFQIFVGCSD